MNTSKLTELEMTVYKDISIALQASPMDDRGKERAATASAMYAGLIGQEGFLLANYPILQIGTYEPSGGQKFTVTESVLQGMLHALNRMVEIGKPLALLLGHDAPQNGGYVIGGDRVEDGTLYAHLYGDEFLIKGIRAGLFGLSMEAMRDFQDTAYSGDTETYEIWPSAWAALPANEIPACPAQDELPLGELGKIAANSGKSVIWFQTTGSHFSGANKPREDNTMDTEQIAKLQSTVDGLVETVAGLVEKVEGMTKVSAEENTPPAAPEKASDSEELKKAKEKIAELEAEIAELKKEKEDSKEQETKEIVASKTKVIMGRLATGSHKDFEKMLDSKGSPAEKLAVLEDMESILPEVTASIEGARFARSRVENTPGDVERRTADNVELIRAAGKMAEKEGISSSEAMEILQAKK